MPTCVKTDSDQQKLISVPDLVAVDVASRLGQATPVASTVQLSIG